MDRVPRGGARALVGMCLPTLHLGRDPSGPYGGAFAPERDAYWAQSMAPLRITLKEGEPFPLSS